MDGIRLAGTPAFAAILSPSDFESWTGSSATPTATCLGFITKTTLDRARHNCGSAPAPAAVGRGVDHHWGLALDGNRSIGQRTCLVAPGGPAPVALAALRKIETPRWNSAPGEALDWMTESTLLRTGARWLTTIGAPAGLLPVGPATGPKVIGNCAIGTSVVGADAREHLDGDLDNSRLS